MPITDLLDNVPPNPPGFVPYTPPPPQQEMYELVVDGNGNDQGIPYTPPNQSPPIPDNIFGFFMLMMGM